MYIRDIIRYNIARASARIAELKGSNPAFGGISPKSADWPVYRAAKREASLWLTALKILKASERHDIPLERKSDFSRLLAADGERARDSLANTVCEMLPRDPQSYKMTGRFMANLRRAMETRQSIYAHGGHSLAMRAFGAVRKAANRLKKSPGRYADVEKWVQEKTRLYAEKNTEKELANA